MAVCIYHKNCNDGTMAAAIVLSKIPDIKLFALNYNYPDKIIFDIVNAMENNETVYIVDFSLKDENDYKILFIKADRIINLDHHIGAKDKLENLAKQYSNFQYVFNNNQSGATLTWEYFYDDNIPEIVKYVEDRDLWKWQYGDITKYVNAYLFMLVDKPEIVKDMLKQEVTEIIEKGKIISDYNDFLVNRFVEKTKAIELQIGDHIVKAYNFCLLQSEVGHELSNKENQAVAIYNLIGDRVIISFRSQDEHEPSALELAKMLKGSGHRNAAGVNLHFNEFIALLKRS